MIYCNLIYIFVIIIHLKSCNVITLGNERMISRGKLIMTHIIFRHGDRAPVDTSDMYPNDPYKHVRQWPVPWGELTNTGKVEQYELGKWLGRRYRKLLGSEYSNDKIYIQSTDIDRTIMSAQANLAGMFHPINKEIWNKYINWQPIPVHTVPLSDDKVLGAFKRCTVYEEAYKQLRHTKLFKNIDKKLHKLYQYLTYHTGGNITTIENVFGLYNLIAIQDIYNKTLPGFLSKVYHPGSIMEAITYVYFTVATYTPTLARLKMGFLLKEILDRCHNKTLSILEPDRVMWMYSAHDFTLASFLNTLNLYYPHYPPYSACILIELTIQNDIPYITIYYKDTVELKLLKPLEIPGCGRKCPLKEMYTLYKNVLPVYDFEHECQVNIEHN